MRQLLFADDTVLVANSKRKLERLLEEFRRVCRRRKLKVNVVNGNLIRSVREYREYRDGWPSVV